MVGVGKGGRDVWTYSFVKVVERGDITDMEGLKEVNYYKM